MTAKKEDVEQIMVTLQKLMKQNTQSFDSLSGRLSALEEKAVDVKTEVSNQTGGNGGMTENVPVVVSSAKEKCLSLTFGEADCSPNNLRLFIEHFSIAKEQNIAKRVTGWGDGSFRANELRFQLRGDPALWLAQECAMLKDWTKDDDKIIAKLKERYMSTQSIELNIIAFEELSQNRDESLAQYMTRCQQKGFEAFGGMKEPLGTQQRIVWKFLYGIRDPDVRNAVIREKWMKSGTEAKGYDEVLKIAETAKMNKAATAATGPGDNRAVTKVAAFSRVKERRDKGGRHQSSDSSESDRSTGRSSSSNSTAPGSGVNFKCHYCNSTSHYGGWKACPKRAEENPRWTPSNTGKGFQ